MVITGWSVRGGSGTTVVTAGLATVSASTSPTLLIDLCGDSRALFQLPAATPTGLLDWAVAHHSVGPQTIADLITPVPLPTGVLHVLEGGHASADLAQAERDDFESRLAEGLGWITSSYRRVIIDAGHRANPITHAITNDSCSVLVIRPCILSIRAALRSDRPVVGAVIVGNGPSLPSSDIEAILGVPVLGQLNTCRSVPSAVDAGSFAQRLPRELARLGRTVLSTLAP
jgi:hypothetical protein